MEDKQSHPIPQDVTGFQFRLIGDMTVKQFAYLAGPAFAAWVFFQLPFPLLIKVPVSLVLGGIGASLAFLPIAGRPMDVMIINFIKALFKSTLYIYKKRGMINTAPTIGLSYQKPNVYSPPAPAQHVMENPVFQQVLKKPKTQQEEDEDSKRKAVVLEKNTEQKQAASGIENQLQAALAQKELLTKQLIALQQRLDIQKKNFFIPTVAKAPLDDKAKPKIQTQNVRQVPKSLGKNLGLPTAPEAPNVITGIIKDPRGNPLGNILVEIKDAEGNPVRAFKTNGVGRFASATPLTNGVYTISFEDPKGENKFDAVEFTVKGEVILPLEVISVDTREELRKTLFKEN